MNIYLLDGKDVTSRESAYRLIERTLGFPDWFGHNLDALADSLCELDADEDAVVFVNTGALIERLGNYGNKILACFRDTAGEFGYTWIEKE